jgi:hypothetical protein
MGLTMSATAAMVPEDTAMRDGWSVAARARGGEAVAISAGRRDRMFPELPDCRPDTAALLRLAAAMVDRNPADPRRDNPEAPAGYAILAQFVDHDLTFDPARCGAPRDALFDDDRAPRLALDSMYGAGPDFAPHLYEAERPWRFAIGTTGPARAAPTLTRGAPHDLPRAGGAALIGDPRNDTNLALSQLHLAFCKVHNAVADRHARGDTADERFAEARRLVGWHYQWVVLEDFARRLCDPATLRRVRAGLRFFDAGVPSLPDEFVGAAFRVGHAMAREEFDLNDVFSAGGVAAPVGLDRLFGPRRPGAEGPMGLDWAIDWRRFFAFPRRPDGGVRLNLCRRIEPLVPPGLDALLDPAGAASAAPGRLAARNLLLGREIGLPSGQAVARAMGVASLTPDEVATGPDGAAAQAGGLCRETPLWHYCLKEAQVRAGGRRLGPVGSQIVAETLVAVVEATPGSYLAVAPGWRPTLPRRDPARFDMVDLLSLAGEPNPIAAAGGLRRPGQPGRVLRPEPRAGRIGL